MHAILENHKRNIRMPPAQRRLAQAILVFCVLATGWYCLL